jgi:hypothetical protein
MPPSEKPTMFTFLSPRASQNSTASRAISKTVPGVSPPELATPALLKTMMSWSAAKPSVTDGSQSSRFPVK